jgi:hypothetical protein
VWLLAEQGFVFDWYSDQEVEGVATMSDRQVNLLVWAAALVVVGVLLLLFNLGVLARYEPTAQYVVAGLLAVGGFAALVSYFWRREQWWRLMPGWTLLALAAMVMLSLNHSVPRPYIAATLFVGLALAFANLYGVNRAEHWWAIIPGGFMLVLAGVIALTVMITRLETLGAILFAGMGVVFGLVYVLAGKRRHWWALIPAGVLLFFGLLTYSVDNEVQNALLRWWPAALIVLGAIVAFYSTTQYAPPERLSINTARSMPPPSNKGAQLGEYSQPAPGASIEVLSDPDHR